MPPTLPDWAAWTADPARAAWTVGVEEEVMLLDPELLTLAHRIDDVLPALDQSLAGLMSAETHACAIEFGTGVHENVGVAVRELASIRGALATELNRLELAAAVAGTHPFARGEDTEVSKSARYQTLHEGLRELARREPTFAMHVHVGLPDPELAMRAADRLRAHLPFFLALSANSPYWRGRDSGMASFRTPLFGAFPRSGVPRQFGAYSEWVEAVDLMLRSDAFPEPTFIWWDVRLQPRFGTVEIRIADAQTRVSDVAAVAALVQAVTRLEATEGYAPAVLVGAQEVLEENRFLAARDGLEAQIIDPVREERVPLRDALEDLLVACEPHADDLGCRAELDSVRELAASPGYQRQRDTVAVAGQHGLVAELAESFAAEPLGRLVAGET